MKKTTNSGINSIMRIFPIAAILVSALFSQTIVAQSHQFKSHPKNSGDGDGAVSVLVQVDLPVTFDDATVNYDLVDFGGDASAIVFDPVVPTNKVCKTIKTNTAVTWAGTTIGGTTFGFANPVPFAPGSTKMTMRIYSPNAGTPILMKVEDPLDPAKSVETQKLTTVANAWETLEFDFANNAAGTPAINYTYNYKKLSVFPNFGISGATAGEKTYYWDDVAFVGGTGPTTVAVTFQVYNPDSVPVFVFGSWGNWLNWPGDLMSSVGNGYYAATLHLPKSTPFEYLYVNGGVAPIKEVLDPSWPCTNGNTQYTNRVLTLGSNDTTICFTWATCNSCTVPVMTQVDLPVTFDDNTVNYDLVDFGGNSSIIDIDPVVPTNKVSKTIKTIAAETWAGTTIGGSTGGFATVIPLAPGSTTMTMRVYSPDAGIPVRMKVEDPNDPTKSVETEDMTTVANAWETLEFDFSNEAPGTAAINFTYIYKKCSVFFNFGTTGAMAGAKTYYFDDVRFSGSIMVTFQVQVSDAVPVYIFGGWNNWANWPGTPMVAMGGNIYTVSVPMAGNQAVEYLFVSGTNPVKEVLDPTWPCTNGNTQYTNRLTSMGANDTTMCVKWATCESCTFTSVGDLSEDELKISLLENGIRLSSNTILEANQIEVFDLMGRMIYSSTQGWKMNTLIPVKFSGGGIYVVRIKADNKLFSHKGLLIK